MDPLTALLMLTSLVAGGVSTYKNEKYKKNVDEAGEKQRKQNERKGLQGAMARALGVDVVPYEKQVAMPKAPNTMWSDMLQAGASAGAQGLSQYQANKMYPMEYPQQTAQMQKIPRRTPQGYML